MAKKAPGLGEQRQAPMKGLAGFYDTPHYVVGDRLKIGPGGRVVIPANMREAMGVSEGDTLLATLVDGELRLLSTGAAVKRAQAIVAAVIPPGGPSLVDELIADRRKEAERERNS